MTGRPSEIAAAALLAASAHREGPRSASPHVAAHRQRGFSAHGERRIEDPGRDPFSTTAAQPGANKK